jgi:hypothetical protein
MSRMVYPKTCRKLLAVVVLGRYPNSLLVYIFFQKILLIIKSGNLPENAAAGFQRFPEVSLWILHPSAVVGHTIPS